MAFKLILVLFFLLWSIASLSLWTERKGDRDLLLLVWFGAIGFFAEFIDYLLRYIFYAPLNILSFIASFLLVFNIIFVLMVLWVGFKMLVKKK
jgi:hypothetical protein